jgi:hydrogenase expression/formation protein HypE
MDDTILPVGKLPVSLLRTLLADIPATDPDVLVGPGIGEDAAAIRFGNQTLLFKTDPITLTSDEIAWYLITINSNDIACMGGIPKYLLVTFLLPEGLTTTSSVNTLFSNLRQACTHSGITLVGGHTEITHGINRPIATGFMVGTLLGEGVVRTSDACPGNLVLLSKSIPIEAACIIAREKPDMLDLEPERLNRAQNLIYNPGISVVKEAHIALKQGGVTAMHDPTEGGLATGLREIAQACGYGITVEEESIQVLDLAEPILARFAIDPLGALASGSLLVCCKEDSAGKILSAWDKNGVPGAVIGRITKETDMILRRGGKDYPMPEFASDEITKIFSA